MAYNLSWLKAAGYSTVFPLTENPISEGGKWLNGGTDGLDWHDIQTASSLGYAASLTSGTNDCVAQLKSSVFAATPAQYVTGTMHVVGGYAPSGGFHELNQFLHFSITPHGVSGYESYLSIGGAHTVVRWNGPLNDFTPLASANINTPSAPANGDVCRFEITAAGQLSWYQNGILITRVTDTTFATGQPGFGANPSGSNIVLSSYAWSYFEAGNL